MLTFILWGLNLKSRLGKYLDLKSVSALKVQNAKHLPSGPLRLASTSDLDCCVLWPCISNRADNASPPAGVLQRTIKNSRGCYSRVN